MDENENASVLGMAYEIEGRKCEKTFKHLDFREKCGYAKYEVKFHPIESNIKNEKHLFELEKIIRKKVEERSK